MPNLLTPPGRTEPVPENLADLLIAHDHGIITANLLGTSRHLLPRARLQRNWPLQERLRGAGFCLLRLPGALRGPRHSSNEEDLVYVALDMGDRKTLQENLIRLAREFGQSQVILCRRGLPLREMQLAGELDQPPGLRCDRPEGLEGTDGMNSSSEISGNFPLLQFNASRRSAALIDTNTQAVLLHLPPQDGRQPGLRRHPGCPFSAALAEYYPEAKVMLTVRDPGQWFASVQSTIFGREWIEFLPGTEAGACMKATINDYFDGRMHDHDHLVRRFNEHVANVRKTIAPARLLVFEVADGWEPLCEFLEVPPQEAFPRINDTAAVQGLIRAIMDNGFQAVLGYQG